MVAKIWQLLGISLRIWKRKWRAAYSGEAGRPVSVVISYMVFCSLACAGVIEVVFLQLFQLVQFLSYNKAAAFCYTKGIFFGCCCFFSRKKVKCQWPCLSSSLEIKKSDKTDKTKKDEVSFKANLVMGNMKGVGRLGGERKQSLQQTNKKTVKWSLFFVF